jgi:hypothetical protein
MALLKDTQSFQTQQNQHTASHASEKGAYKTAAITSTSPATVVAALIVLLLVEAAYITAINSAAATEQIYIYSC